MRFVSKVGERLLDSSSVARAALMVLAVLTGGNSAFAGELIPVVASLQLHREAVVVDARPGPECLKATIPGALCLSLDNVLNVKGRLANIRDIRWLLGSFGLSGNEYVVIFADEAVRRDGMATILYLAGQARVSRLDQGVAVELVGRGRSGALSREVSFSKKVRIRHLIPAPLGRMEKTELAEFVAEVNRDASVSFPWPMGYL